MTDTHADAHSTVTGKNGETIVNSCGGGSLSGIAEKSSFSYEDVEKIAQHILQRVKCRPKLGIICGSGLGQLADQVQNQELMPYSDIPGFPTSTVVGHSGTLVFGTLEGKSVVLMKGRAHCYEGYSMQQTALPVRTMKLMGVSTLLVTNAAGGINASFAPGDLMIIKDHINMPGFGGVNPLVGPNDERFGTRFPPLSACYDLELRTLAKKSAEELGFGSFVKEGVYCMCYGPYFETVAEAKYMQMIGVDAVGMSTVSEVIAAVHCGMRVFAMSLVSNLVTQEFDSKVKINHTEVLEMGKARSKDVQRLISALVGKLEDL